MFATTALVSAYSRGTSRRAHIWDKHPTSGQNSRPRRPQILMQCQIASLVSMALIGPTSSIHAYRRGGEYLKQSATYFHRLVRIGMRKGHTRATLDSTSSGPIPAPRTRPMRRKKTTAAQITHRTAIAINESRACLVMAIYSACAMVDIPWRWRRGV